MIPFPRVVTLVALLVCVTAAHQEDAPNESFFKLLLELKHRQSYHSILLENCASSAIVKEIWVKLEIPTLTVLTSTQHEQELKMIFNRLMLVIVCFEDDITTLDVLTALAEQLQHMRETHIILMLGSSTAVEIRHRQMVEKLFRHCQTLHMLNVIAVLGDFESSQLVLTFDAFPQFQLKANKFDPSMTYFADKTRQLFGHPIYTLPDQNEPRSLLFRERSGELKMSGYVGQLVLTFRQYINATLCFPFNVKIGETKYLVNQLNFTRSGAIDFATSLASYKFFGTIHEYTTAVDFTQWMMMLPVERDITVNEMFLYIFRSATVINIIIMSALVRFLLNLFQYFQFLPRRSPYPFWSLVILRDQSFRGILGQPFPIAPYNSWRISFIYSAIFVIGLINSCLFSIYLKTFLTQPPRKPRISSLEGLANSDLRVLINEQEIEVFKRIHGDNAWERYKSGFEVISSFQEFISRRLSFDTSRGYTLTSPLWPIIEVRQSSYRRKLFRLTTDIILDDLLFFGIPIQENSIYKPLLDWFIMAVREAGLIQHWHLLTFYDMVSNGSIELVDVSFPGQSKILTLTDFYWIGCKLGTVYSLCILSFVLELLIFEFRKKKSQEFQKCRC